MQEEWRIAKSITRPTGLEIRYMLSNNGNAKLQAYIRGKYVGEEYLKLGYGLYINSVEELCIYHLGKKPIYRLIYELFSGNIPKGYQIHHLDYNHYNNNINNLVCVSPYDHGQYHINTSKYLYGHIPHKEDPLYEDYNIWLKANDIKERICAYNYTALDAKEDIFNKIYIIFENKSISIREQLKQERKEQKIKQKEKQLKEIEQQRKLKIESGNYIVNCNGHLCKKHISKWTTERYNKVMQTRENSDAWKNRNQKLKGHEPWIKGKHKVWDNKELNKYHFE